MLRTTLREMPIKLQPGTTDALRRAILQKISNDEMLQRARKTGTPPTLWAGMEIGVGRVQPQKKAVWRFLRTLNRLTAWSGKPTPALRSVENQN